MKTGYHGFHLEKSDIIGLLKIPLHVEAILIIRKIFSSNVIIVKFRDEKNIVLPERIDILSGYEDKYLDDLGVVSSDHWRLNLILLSPYLGSRFIKLWDSGNFDVICRG